METIISVGPAGNQAVAVLGRVAWMAVTGNPGRGCHEPAKRETPEVSGDHLVGSAGEGAGTRTPTGTKRRTGDG